MKKLIPGLLSMLLCLGMATGCEVITDKLPDVSLPGFVNDLLGKDSNETSDSESDSASESTDAPLHAHEKDLKDVKEYLQGIVNEIALETRKDFTLINTYSFFGEEAKYDIAWSVNVEGVTVQEGDGVDTIVFDELTEDTPYVLTATITDPEGCHNVVVSFDAVALKAPQVVPEKITSAPAENTAYKLYMYQSVKAQDLYFVGKMSGFYLATTNASNGDTYENGADIYAEKVAGKDAYYLTFTNADGNKQYLGVCNNWSNGSYHDNAIIADSTDVAEGEVKTFEFTWSDEYKTMVATLNGVKSGSTQDTTETRTDTFFLGTSGSYYTFGACPVSEAADSYVGCLVSMVNKADVLPADKVASEKETLNITTAFNGAVSAELPTKGTTYTDVVISWAVKSGDATVTDNVLTVANPAADTVITLTATFTCGDASVTKDVEINVYPKSPITQVTELKEGEAYAIYMYQANEAKNFYFTGAMSGKYFATTDDITKAADTYIEKVDGGFKIYVLNADNTKSYLTLEAYQASGKSYLSASVSLTAEGSVFTYHDQFKTLCSKQALPDDASKSDTFFLGTYGTFTTISASGSYYMTADKLGTEQFYATFGIIDESAITPPAGGEEGGEVTPPTDAPEAPDFSGNIVATVPVVGTGYAFGMTQGNLNNQVYYLAGGMNGFYMETTTDASKAIATYIEETTGGYYFYTYVDGVKTYINMVVSGTHVNGAYEATASTVYTIDETNMTLIAIVNDAEYWFGTRNDKTYTTMGPCAVSFAGFYGVFYGVADAHEHDYTEAGVTPPTCTQDGYTTYTCTCGESKTDNPVSATGHNFVNGICSVCSEADPDYAPEHQHNYAENVTAPTCTAAGYTTHTCECGDTYTDTPVSATGHNYDGANCTACGAKNPDYVPTQEEIVEMAYALEKDTALTGTYTLTGKIIAIDTPYDSGYKNITVTIVVGDLTSKPMMCYRMKGEGAENLTKADVITVTGKIKNYGGTIEFDTGCTFVMVEKHECAEYTEATCKVPATCTVCDKAKDDVLADHVYVNGQCECGATEGVVSNTVSVTIKDYKNNNNWVNGTYYGTLTMDDVITVSAKKSNNNGKYYDSGYEWRMYQSDKGEVTVTAAEGYVIESVKITYSNKNGGTLVYGGANYATNSVVTVNAETITFSLGSTTGATNGQVKITAIEVTYKAV